ncbi:MAG: hypothetical protein E7656_03200 [Ruminococcaceae bacterium]|nr:hypothetical protein [Oscillospiraceae bacterium]
MNWHKTNIALIIILILIDTFLAFTVLDTYKDTKILPDRLLVEAKENLAASGITFEDNIIDKEYSTKTVYKYSSSMIFAEEMKENAKYTHPCLLSAISFLSSQSMQNIENRIKYFDVPDGTSISVSGDDDTVKASAIITGQTGFEYSDARFNSLVVLTEIKNSLSKLPETSEKLDLHKKINDFFKEVYGSKIKARCLEKQELDGGELFTCILTIDGDDINGMPVCFYIRDEKILHVSGNLFFVSPDAEYSAKLIDGINILYSIPRFHSGDVSVLSQKHEYSTVSLENDGVYIFPVWRIECETENGIKKPLFNALTGEYIEHK